MVIPTLLIALTANICPVEKEINCCVDCEARFLICKKNSDSLAEEMDCLRYKRACQEKCNKDKNG
ncbi:MAG: hypothetical protein K0M45_12125 [Candidatus Paracaedibacteraceae bacterium]|nr:hypothetical protein [Candidatus Paracaedibacteraceae bacterium]